MVVDPLGLAGKMREIKQEVKIKARRVGFPVEVPREATLQEKMKLVNDVIKAAKMQKKRDKWNFVE